MSSITLSASIRSNLLSLQNTTRLLDATSQRLSTGLKVNSALDNPGAFFTARSLTNRANDLNTRKDGIGQAISLLESTDKSITSLTSLVEQAKSKAQQADEAATGGGKTISSEKAGVVTGTTTISTNFGGASAATTLSSLGATFTDTLVVTINGDSSPDTFTITSTATTIEELRAFLDNLVGITAVFNSSSKEIDITANGGTDLKLADGAGFDSFFAANELNGFKADTVAFASGANQTFASKNDANDQVKEVFGVADAAVLTIAVTGGGTNTFTLEDGTSGDASTIADLLKAINDADTALTATYNTVTSKVEIRAAEGVSVTFSDTNINPVASLTLNDGTTDLTSGTAVTYSKLGSETEVGALTTDFRSLLEQINALIGDAVYKGTNLLKASATLDVKFNTKGDSKLTITGKALENDSNGILSGLKFSQKAADYDFTTAGDITSALSDVDDAITELRSVASTFGTSLGIIQTREDFTTELVNALESGAGKLVNASLEEEAAKLLALQTRQALGIQSLAIANVSQQSILALFR